MALIQAADEMIAQGGIEGFSLRAAAQRAGVSPAAPAHHFGGAKGLLTEVAILAYERAGRYIDGAGHSNDIVADVRAVGLAFIKFAIDYPGHFRLMFRNDLVDRSDPRLSKASKEPGIRLGHAVLAYRSNAVPQPGSFEDSAEMLCGIAALHGLANMVIEEKAMQFFKGATAKNFVNRYLPKVVEHLFPRTETHPSEPERRKDDA
ncbi:Transcriptional regulator, TetR family [Acidisarcina polymorpha]|uniref:Transcriptional regulator, TetR family n=1 Tax=Acidisarcina polymorpha TaxID=2211140 RepID=A0A2Z5G4T3_9BACT|nr:Transcriptional regulator, TetR family [Acidisarcina polymorpha]